jgi:hypothetical protein
VRNFDDTALEFVDERNRAVFQLVYMSPIDVRIAGLIASGKRGSEREFDGGPILRSFLAPSKFHEFGIGHGHAFGL